MSGEFGGSDVELDSQGIIMGRSPEHSNLVLSSDEVSARHVRIWPDSAKSGIWVEDMNSTNGTFYRVATGGDESEWVRLSGRRLLTAGSRLRIGRNLAEFEVRRA
jgi:pSer/pThr/pTyr-binding forkhead associated (FHA) protein